MKLRKIHELTPWDDRRIFRLAEGMRMRAARSPDQWSRILAEHRSAPSAPDVSVVVAADGIALQPVTFADQLELGAIAAALDHWRIDNAVDTFDVSLPFKLYPLIGRDAFTKSNSWRRRIYRQPMVIARAGQHYLAGWDGLQAKLASREQSTYTTEEFAALGIAAIGASLTGEEASGFWAGNR